MARWLQFLVLGAACATSVSAQEQQPLRGVEQIAAKLQDLQDHEVEGDGKTSGGLHGRFLHITDIHPDHFYKAGSNSDKDHRCHSGSGDGTGYLGAEGSSCDTPFTLVNETFKWINENLRDSIDFVIWTGDSARHDNDEKQPRTEQEIVELNQAMADKVLEAFQKDDPDSAGDLQIPIVPSIGNNDIMPHNIMKDGPNRWTKRLGEIWHKFIPEEQRHSFHEGGWYFTEVIPDKLAVVSLNTMYFFDKNSAVDGCKHKSEPGYEHMEWLRIQLQSLRKRKMKAIIIGHVPPARTSTKENWDETCWQKYTLWLRQFRDVVVGSSFGHMNIDHFMFQDAHDLTIGGLDIGQNEEADDQVSIQSGVDYLTSLKALWENLPSSPKWYAFPPASTEEQEFDLQDDLEDEESSSDGEFQTEKKKKKKKKKQRRKFLKKIDGVWAERYSVSLVSPSVIPNYFPSLRVIEYNITGLENTPTWAEVEAASKLKDGDDYEEDNKASPSPVEDDSDDDYDDTEDNDDTPSDNDADTSKKGKKNNKKKKKKKPKSKIPKPPSKSAPPGPAYSNQPLTWLGYTQYYANLTRLNAEIASMERESTTYDSTPGWREFLIDKYTDNNKKGGKKPKDPIPFEYEVEYDTRTDKVYNMEDMTVRSYFGLASMIAGRSSKHSVLDSSDDADADVETDSSPNETIAEDSDDTVEINKQTRVKTGNKVWKTFVKRAFVGYEDDD
ncbi:Endopolyphosphatase [Arachnomyces sp. PD_36]|nr:Endopolyphosphatase [Arachnomyces sp. PD_36]